MFAVLVLACQISALLLLQQTYNRKGLGPVVKRNANYESNYVVLLRADAHGQAFKEGVDAEGGYD